MIEKAPFRALLLLLTPTLLFGCEREEGATSRELFGNTEPLVGRFLGMNPPNTAPELFAPGVMCNSYQSHSAPAFDPLGRFVFWSMWLDPYPVEVILFMEQKDGVWSQPELAPFSLPYPEGQPFFSHDGTTLYFNSKRPVAGESEPNPTRRMWAVARGEAGWGEPYRMDLGGVEPEAITMAENGTVFFTMFGGPGRNDDIYMMERDGGTFGDPVRLPDEVNSPYPEFIPEVSADGNILVFTAIQRPGGYAFAELYVSFRRPDGSWTEAENLGEAINQGSTRFPRFSPGGDYLFFTSDLTPYADVPSDSIPTLDWILETNRGTCAGTENVYWVSRAVLDALRPGDLR